MSRDLLIQSITANSLLALKTVGNDCTSELCGDEVEHTSYVANPTVVINRYSTGIVYGSRHSRDIVL